MINKVDKNSVRVKRHQRMRHSAHNPISGTAERPRLCVYRSTNHIYAQVIDDTVGHTLVSSSTLAPEVKSRIAEATKCDAAKIVGEEVAKKALEAGIKQVVFDRGGYRYTGRVAQVAAGAREAGLEF